MGIEVVTVSKKPQKLSRSATAIFVITQEDIRRSGVTSIPEALRMVPGIQVARVDANKWAISARGFNGRFSNKLLVLMDGRTVYNPMFAGVLWENQDTMLEDIDRIEVIRGSGGTLWGNNAVNGVINIITKHTEKTQGSLTSIVGGTEEGILSLRHGGAQGQDFSYRIYTKIFNRDTAFNQQGAHDDWRMFRSGFRADWNGSPRDTLFITGDLYAGQAGQQITVPNLVAPTFRSTVNEDSDIHGGNLLFRWTHEVSQDSDTTLQIFYDYFDRHETALNATINTFDIDFQHRFLLPFRQEIVWGAAYRYWEDKIPSTFVTTVFPDSQSFNLISGFLQDEIAIIPETLWFTIGSKLSHNDFTGIEVQPSGRILWSPITGHSLWAAVSRAVRVPTRLLDNSAITTLGNNTPATIRGNQQIQSEVMHSFEAGYRLNTIKWITVDLAGFYNIYDELRGIEVNPFPPTSVPTRLNFVNNSEARTYGIEIATDLQLRDWWRIRGAYSYLKIDFERPTGPQVITTADGRSSPFNQFSLRSLMNFPHNLEFDSWVRVVDSIKNGMIPSYVELDVRFGWKPFETVELSLVGQNLLDSHHPEFLPSFISTQQTEIQRSMYGKMTWTF